ncbi:MAG: POTRA domain-containing protein [Chitinophagales bacterium]
MQRFSIYLVMFAISALLYKAEAQHIQDNPSEILPTNNGSEIKMDDPISEPFVVRNIFITGNRKTKASIILREIPFKTGDHFQLQQLVSKFEDARRQLMNTTLFHEVTVALKSFEGHDVDIVVDVKERWYLFPVPYFRIVDRNINQWLVQNKASLDRVNYGIKLIYNNVTGYNDNLDFWLMSGYTRQISMNYDRLYFDKQMKWGVKFGFALGKNREINYNTINNKQVFLKDTNNFIRSFFKTNLELTYRRAIKTRHRFGIAYTQEKVEDTIMKLNPSYFTPGHNRISYPELYYTMSFHNDDYIPYPLKGFESEVNFSKKGFNHIVNAWELKVTTGNYWQIFPKTYFSINTASDLKLPFKQPFFNTHLMGYDDLFMRGYEYYVIDGVAGGCLKTTFSRELLKFTIHLPKLKHETINYIPFRIYGKIFGDAGYVYNPQAGSNFLNNRMLYSGGLGLDIVTIYDVCIKLEWSFNQLGQNGIYLHRNNNFGN